MHKPEIGCNQAAASVILQFFEAISNSSVGLNLFDLIPKFRVRNWKIITCLASRMEVGFVLQMTRKPVHNNFVQR